MTRVVLGLTLAAGLLGLLGPGAASAQVVTLGGHTYNLATLPLVAAEAVPAMGSFHRIQRLNFPPLPINNCPGCPVYWLGGNVYLIDDSSVDYAAREAAFQAVRTLRSAARQAGVGAELDALLGIEDEQLFLGDGFGPMLA